MRHGPKELEFLAAPGVVHPRTHQAADEAWRQAVESADVGRAAQRLVAMSTEEGPGVTEVVGPSA